MTIFTPQTMILVVSLTALVAASASAEAQQTYRRKAHLHRFAVPRTATAFVPAPAPVRGHETDGLSRNADDCAFGCIDNGG